MPDKKKRKAAALAVAKYRKRREKGIGNDTFDVCLEELTHNVYLAKHPIPEVPRRFLIDKTAHILSFCDKYGFRIPEELLRRVKDEFGKEVSHASLESLASESKPTEESPVESPSS